MKQFLVLIAFAGLAVTCRGQGKFSMDSRVGGEEISVNGKRYQVDSSGVKIPTNYPRFDTLVFHSDYMSARPIICNFKPDSSYSISMACCSELDIIPTSRYKHFADGKHPYTAYMDTETGDDEQKIDSITKLYFMDRPYISIRTKTTPKDSIFAWHSDAACETELHLLTDKPWALGVPPKCFYWSNITYIFIFKQDPSITEHPKKDIEEFIGMPNIVELATVAFRLFDNQRFVITYDEARKRAVLGYE